MVTVPVAIPPYITVEALPQDSRVEVVPVSANPIAPPLPRTYCGRHWKEITCYSVLGGFVLLGIVSAVLTFRD